MRIAHVITRLLKAGAEENTLITCIFQAKEGCQVYLFYGDEFEPSLVEEAESNDITCIQIPCMVHAIRPVSDARAIFKLRNYFTELKFDVVHTHQSKAGILGRLAAVSTNTTVIHSVHIVPFDNTGLLRKYLYIAVEKFCSCFTHHFIDVSAGTKETYLKYSIGKIDNHAVVYSGMDVKKFMKHRDIDNEKIHSGKFKVVMIAAFQKRKRHKELLESLEHVLKGNANIELMFLGQGESESEIKLLVSDLKLENQVRFMGFVENPEFYIKDANLGVLVSEREGLPRVFVQFMASGIPVVSTCLPGIEEIVEHNINGIVVGINDVDSVASHIKNLANDTVKMGRLRVGALNTDVQRWNISAMGPSIVSVYRKAIQRRIGTYKVHSV